METPQILRDCLKNIFDNGSPQEETHRHAYFLAKEFKRLDLSPEKAIGEMEGWAKRCDPPLVGSKLRGIFRTVQKVYAKDDPPLSCAPDKTLKREGHCFLKSESDCFCEFNEAVKTIKEFQRNKILQEGDLKEWEKYWQQKHNSLWLYLVAFYETIRLTELERGIPQGGDVFIGFREIRLKIMVRHLDYKPSLDTLCLCSKIVESDGLLLVNRTPQNQRGTFKRKANGYNRVLPIPKPPDYTHIMSDTQIMCSSGTNTYMCSSVDSSDSKEFEVVDDEKG